MTKIRYRRWVQHKDYVYVSQERTGKGRVKQLLSWEPEPNAERVELNCPEGCEVEDHLGMRTLVDAVELSDGTVEQLPPPEIEEDGYRPVGEPFYGAVDRNGNELGRDSVMMLMLDRILVAVRGKE